MGTLIFCSADRCAIVSRSRIKKLIVIVINVRERFAIPGIKHFEPSLGHRTLHILPCIMQKRTFNNIIWYWYKRQDFKRKKIHYNTYTLKL